MFEIKKTFEIAVAHKLNLPYESKCNQLHGHNLRISVYCRSHLNANGMVVDFTEIKKKIQDKLDHKNLNDIKGLGFALVDDVDIHKNVMKQKIPLNPTAENIAFWICGEIKSCYRVDVQESEGNVATFIWDM